MDIAELVNQKHARAVELRHALHATAELGYQEHQTAAIIREELRRLGVGFITGPQTAPTATIAVLGEAAKPCIALRADIDALPIVEQTGLPYASANRGLMHACGHDGHSAILLGVAAVLKELAAELPVCVKLIWQPAEEGGAGAQRLVEAGVLDGRLGPQVSAVFGLHGWPGLAAGVVASRSGAILAANDNFWVKFIGKGCHGAYPHLGRDPIPAAAEAILNLQHFISRETDPTDPVALTVGVVEAGSAVNVIPDVARIGGTVRTLSSGARQSAAASIRRRCEAIAAAHGCTVGVDWQAGYPPTINDPQMHDYVARVARGSLGALRFAAVERASMGAEDFAYYLRQVKGCFFLLGVRPPHLGECPSLHCDRFDFPDLAMPAGMRMFVELALHWSD